MIELDEKACAAIDNARALIDAMLAGGWRQVCVTGADGDYFLTREAGALNPLLAPAEATLAPSPPVTVATSTAAITAPHVATLAWLAAPGTVLARGATVARLTVLDETVDLPATQAGTVGAHRAKIGDLVEYGTALLNFAA